MTLCHKKRERRKRNPALTTPDNVASTLQPRQDYDREKEVSKRQTNPKKEKTILIPPSTKNPHRFLEAPSSRDQTGQRARHVTSFVPRRTRRSANGSDDDDDSRECPCNTWQRMAPSTSSQHDQSPSCARCMTDNIQHYDHHTARRRRQRRATGQLQRPDRQNERG